MFRKLVANFRKPSGFFGGLATGMMNWGHGPMTRAVVERLDIRPEDVVLDIGCGGGAAIARMAATGARVYGVDYSDISVRKTLAKNKAAVRAGRVSVEKADVRSLPFPDETFTLVTAFETVFFWDEVLDCFRRIRSALKPGGRFAVVVEAWKKDDGTVNCSPAIVNTLRMNLYSVAEFRDLLQTAGFDAISSVQGERNNWLCVLATK